MNNTAAGTPITGGETAIIVAGVIGALALILIAIIGRCSYMNKNAPPTCREFFGLKHKEKGRAITSNV